MAVEKLLPQNVEAEVGVLGSLLIDPEAIVQVADFLRPEDFYRDAHRTIFEAVLDLYEAGRPADLITLSDDLARRGKLDEIGGISYVSSLANQVPTYRNIKQYAQIVERTAILRRLIHAAGQIAGVAYNDPDADDALEQAEKLIYDVSQRSSRSEFDSVGNILRDYLDKLDQLHERRGSIVGVGSGFSDLDKMTGGLQKSDLIILAARPAVGKCLTAHTLIDDPLTGARLTIEECVQRRLPTVFGVSAEGKVREAAITDWIDSGVQPVFRVRTRTGREVEVTGHHPFLTVHGWTPLHDLAVGDSIAVPNSVPVFGSDESWPIERVRLLAYLITEGCLTDHSPEFTNTDPVIIEDFKAIIAQQFPECAIRQEKITYIAAQPRRAGVRTPPNPLTQWLRELGLWGKLAQDKAFPSCVWTWSKAYLAEFLRVLMSCDGSIYAVGGYPRIEFTVASPQLASDVQHAFIRFGLAAKRYVTSHGAYRVQITDPASVRRYQETIGWVGEKSQRFAELAGRARFHPGNMGHAPKVVWPLVRAAAQRQGFSMVQLAQRTGETTRSGRFAGYNPHTGRGLPRYRLARYAEVLGDAHLLSIAGPDIYWDEITAVEPLGEQQVYDLTVPDGENFIAQDVFVHNTALALSLAHNAALRYSHGIAVFSLEMSKEQLVARLLSMDATVDQHSLRTGYITDDEWERISESVGRLSEAKIYIDDTPSIPLVEMRSKARRLMAERGFDLLVVDYLQLMQGSGGGNGRHENRVQEISEISRGLKGLARELNVPVLALSQLSRSVESRTDKKPQLSDLRECVIGSTRLIDARSGRWVPITQIHRGDEIIGMGAHQQLGRFAVDDVWSTGVKPTFTMTTRTGRTITATANHPLYTPTGWKALGELQPGDMIATALRLPAHGQEIAARAELCRLLGYLTGDGTYQKHRGIGFISADPLTLEDVSAIVQQAFPNVQVREKTAKGCAREAYYVTVFDNGFGKPYGNPLREWLRSLDVLGQRDYQKHVPAWVFDAGAVGASQFLAGYLATDGCVKTRVGKHGVARWDVHFDTVSIDLARDVQALLLRIGVISRIDQGRFNSKSARAIYRITVAASPDNLRRFAAAVPARGKKRLLLDAMCEQLPEMPTHRSGFFGLPTEVSTLIAEQSRVAGMHWTETWRDQGRRMRRETCIEWAERLNSDELRDWAASDLLWEDISTIEPSGEQEVFDIHVPGCNNFLANGIVAHNSGAIEQDADIVMFIYRDEVYNPDTDRKNIADIIVAKHRNGPVGQVSLYFQAAQTRYRDLDLRTPDDY